MFHVRAFDRFLDTYIPEILGSRFGVIHAEHEGVEHRISYTNYRHVDPIVTVEDCERFKQSYMRIIMADVRYDKIADGKTETEWHRDRIVVYLPDIIRKGPFTGTFICHGQFRFIPMKLSLRYNLPFFWKKKDGKFVCELRAEHMDRPHRSTSTLNMEFKPIQPGVPKQVLTAYIPFMKGPPVPLPILVLALGGELEAFYRQVTFWCRLPDHHSVMYRLKICAVENEEDALRYIAKFYHPPKTLSSMRNILDSEICSNLNEEDRGDHRRDQKIRYMAWMAGRLIRVATGLDPDTYRESLAVKRVSDVGSLMAQLFRIKFTDFIGQRKKQLKQQIVKGSVIDITKLAYAEYFTVNLQQSVLTGNWTKNRNAVSQRLEAVNKYDVRAQLLRVSSSLINTEGMSTEPRKLKDHHRGRVCSIETPDGQNCGLMYPLAMYARVARYTPFSVTSRIIKWLLREWLSDPPQAESDLLVVDPNGRWLGWIPLSQRDIFLDKVDSMRRHHQVSQYLSVWYTDREIFLSCDRGRLMRKVKDRATGEPRWLDAMEEFHRANLKPFDEYPNAYFGLHATLIPYMRHNNGARAIFGTSMRKQAIPGSFMQPSDQPRQYSLVYSQKPLVRSETSLSDSIKEDGHMVCVVAIYCHPNTTEDAVLLNRASMQRGLGDIVMRRTYKKEINTDTSTYRRQPDAKDHQIASYEHLGDNGIPPRGMHLDDNDVVIRNHTLDRKDEWRDCSTVVREAGQVTTSVAFEGFRQVNVDSYNHFESGDKTANRHGQKGTISKIVSPEDMIFSERTGMIPDMVFGSPGIPSRQTVGMLIEMLAGKTVATTAIRELGYDSQVESKGGIRAFQDHLATILERHGLHGDGAETFRDGQTGQLISCRIFTGPISYQRMTHLVAKKTHCRSRGPRNPFNGQPKDGRRNGGGLKVGYMGMDTLSAYGASETSRERIITLSDPLWVHICQTCGHVAEGNMAEEWSYCNYCMTGDHVARVLMSQCSHMMFEELSALGIKATFRLE